MNKAYIKGNIQEWLDVIFIKMKNIQADNDMIKNKVYVSLDIARKMLNNKDYEPDFKITHMLQCGVERHSMMVFVNTKLPDNTVLIE